MKKAGENYATDRKVKMRAAYAWMLDCKKKGISIEFRAAGPKKISPITREKYAADWAKVTDWVGSADVTQAQVEAYIEDTAGGIKDPTAHTHRFRGAYNWYLDCVQQGLPVERNALTIDGVTGYRVIEYEKMIKHVVEAHGDVDFTDEQALKLLGHEYRNKIDHFKEALAWRHTTKR